MRVSNNLKIYNKRIFFGNGTSMNIPDDGNTGKNQGNPFNAIRAGGPLLGAGVQMAAAVVLMFFFGRWLDTKFGTDPWLMMAGSLIGAGGGLFSFIRTALKAGKSESEKNSSTKK